MAVGGDFANMVNTLVTTFGSSVTVTLKNSGPSYTMQAAVGRRRNDSMTGGLDQTIKVVIFEKPNWDSKVARPPEIGDRVDILGVKYAITAPDVKMVNNVAVAYKCELKG